MATEHLKDGPVTYAQTSAMVTLAEKWLLEYFAAFGQKRPGDLEDDFCGKPSALEMTENPQGRWRDSPFCPALARLVDRGAVHWWKADNGDFWYALKKSRKLRQYRFQLADSMRTVIEVEPTKDVLYAVIQSELGRYGHEVTPDMVHVEKHCFDERIGWDAHIVTVDGYGVYGFMDGPLS